MNSSTNKEVYVFFGVTGAGKSSTINTLCGETKCKVGEDETSETQNCKLVEVDCPKSIFHGKSLLDMQGYNDTRPEQNQSTIFNMTKLYFLKSSITCVKCFIFVVNMSDTKTDFYRRFSQFLGLLFGRENVERNALILLTKGDSLSASAKEKKLQNIKKCIANLDHMHGWRMEMIEWSNVKALPDQEKLLFAVISRLPGFNPKATLKEEEDKIKAEAQSQYESRENIENIQHEAKQELKDTTVTRKETIPIAVHADESVKNEVPAEVERTTYSAQRQIQFKGHILEEEGILNKVGNGIVRVASPVLSVVCAVAGIKNQKTQSIEVMFDDPVVSVELKESSKPHLMQRLDYKIDASNRQKVIVYAYFSHAGGPILTWDFNVTVTGNLERTHVIKEAHTTTTVLQRQKIEMVEKDVVIPSQKLEVVREAYEQKLYKRTFEEIRQSIIDKRIREIS
ncbi:unnamed protein product [Rotaria sp. Silwood2]|nr:unnamed protein product [Rotaria sp. Silwood2]CAF3303586.1 unnamed protein product [Rotaria sp. Silwood2]CAF4020843.1 unnamed protein product [Rotaria sp. Silwood2]CAF4052762.1 unnamed protein product [Rotaria sp. Silwood2]